MTSIAPQQPYSLPDLPLGEEAMKEIRESRERLLMDHFLPSFLEAIPDYVLILNRDRRVLAMNSKLLRDFGITAPESLVGRRPGETMRCVNAGEGADGCGSGRHCRTCGALLAIIDSEEGATAAREVRITVDRDDWHSLDLEVRVTRFSLAGMDLQLFSMRDIGAEKRRRVLEQTFFHDVLNTVGAIRGMAYLLADGNILGADEEEQYKKRLLKHSDRLVEEILFQRNLTEAEKGEFRISPGLVRVPELLEEMINLYSEHHVSRGKRLVLGSCVEATFVTDRVIIGRIIGNLLKNALEASSEGETVTLSAAEEGDGIVLSVNNAGVMPEEVQMQLFQRSFSTKAGEGRGIGTYSVKLFGERCLKGKVSFTSREPEGTTFSIHLPMSL